MRTKIVFKQLLLVVITSLLFITSISAKEIKGIIVDYSTMKPIDKAVVMLLHQNKIYSMVATDSMGVFSFGNIELDRFYVKAKRIGYAEALTGPLRIPNSDTLKLIIKLEAQEITLDEVVIREKFTEEWLEKEGYYKRKDIGMGKFLKVSDIKGRTFGNISQILQTIPGLVVKPTTNNIKNGQFGPQIFSNRSLAIGGGQVTVYVDGIPLDEAGLIDIFNPNDIAAFEFYPSSSTAPAKYSLKAGGVLLIWTKK
jgi:hypothetical protein